MEQKVRKSKNPKRRLSPSSALSAYSAVHFCPYAEERALQRSSDAAGRTAAAA
jgi:hypothetical protein